MSERISIIEEIKKGGYEASLITTFNAYLPFYEEVVLRKLIGQGVQHNVVLMDSAQCSQSISNHPPRLAGRHYSLVPISSPGAFHPKVILLLGRNKGALLVGSHNLTLSGFGYNRELTNMIRVQGKDDPEAIAVTQAVWRQVLGWVEAQGDNLPGHLSEMVLKLKDFAPWLGEQQEELPATCRPLSTQSGDPSLWDQFRENFNGIADQVLVSGAFFDGQLSFLKRVQQDLNPKSITVGIDPKTVQVPSGKELPGVSFVNASSLGNDETESGSTGYLHAKSLAVRTVDGDFYLATGSANPSAPAWLRPGVTGNTEVMLLRRGPEAEEAARELGLMAIPDLPELTEHDWQEVQKNWQKDIQLEEQRKATTVGICVATEREIVFPLNALCGSDPIDCEILGFDKQLVCSGEIQRVGEGYSLTLPDEKMGLAGFVCCSVDQKNKTFLVHHQHQIEASARTGSQRRFRDALASLSSDSPDLETLIKCVDKIIFAKAEDVNRAANRVRTSTSTSQSPSDPEEGADLSMDLSDTRKAKKKYRLRHSDDLAYLLDVLIYHLRSEVEGAVESSHEKRDSLGRSEEEQVDADDDEEIESDGAASDEIALKTLSLCHGKVRSLVGRMMTQLQSLADGKVTFEDAVVRLTGVLAVLRQLRNCDGKVAWAKQGQTTFPLGERIRLFEKIAETLIEMPNSILSPPGSDFDDADELARLRGLVLWLAWDSGVQLIKKKAFQESRKELEDRLRAKGLMLSLAQLVKDDEVVVEEARQSIGPLCSSDMDWLNWIFSADQALSKFISGDEHDCLAAKVSPGDIGFIAGLPHFGARMILSLDGGKANLAFLNNDDGYRRFQTSAIKFASFDQLMS